MTQLHLECACDPVVRTEFDPSDPEALCQTMIDAVASVEGTPPAELEPLYDAIDLEALARFLGHDGSGDAATFVCVALDEWHALVYDDGRIEVYDFGARTATRTDVTVRTTAAASSD